MIFKTISLNPKIKARDLLVLNGSLILFYFIVVSGLNFPACLSRLIFSTPDTLEYKAFAGWLKGDQSYCSDTRPFLYPLLLLISGSVGGLTGIWFMQFLFWLASVNLLYLSLIRLTDSYVLSLFGTVIFASNLSFIILTMYGLSEVTAMLLLSIFIFYITYYYRERKTPGFILTLLFLGSLLTVVKPVYYLLVLFLLFVVFPLGHFKKYLQRKILFLGLVLSVFPVLIQISIMKIENDTFSVSKISSVTVRDYYYSLLYSQINKISLDEAKKQAKNMTDGGIREYIGEHPSESIRTYLLTLRGNMNAGTELVDENQHPAYFDTIQTMNIIYFKVHRFFLLIVPVLFFILYKHYRDFVLYSYLLAIPLCLIILTSGISFFQGDRLVLPSLPLWIMLYIFTGQVLYFHFFRKNSAAHKTFVSRFLSTPNS